jgi:hypothetical protein
VQQARKAAARAQSLNNLKQQALAVHLFHDANGTLPPLMAHGVAEGPGIPTEAWTFPGPTTHWQLLPYLEQGNLVAQYGTGVPPHGPNNPATLPLDRGYPVAVLMDPTDPSVGVPEITPCGYGFNAQVTGSGPHGAYYWLDQRFGVSLPGPIDPPLFPVLGSLLAVTDGTSNTILLAQRFQSCVSVGVRYGRHPFEFQMVNRALYAPDLLPQFGVGARSCIGGAAQTAGTSILVALCDGSCRSVSAGVAGAVWFAASTPAGGEVLGDW